MQNGSSKTMDSACNSRHLDDEAAGDAADRLLGRRQAGRHDAAVPKRGPAGRRVALRPGWHARAGAGCGRWHIPTGGAEMSFMPGDTKRGILQFVEIKWMVATLEYDNQRKTLS